MKKITKTGEDFIKTLCGSGDDKITGIYEYDLPFTNTTGVTTGYTANADDHNGNLIISNEQLANALIYWYNHYGEKNNIDSNVLAAQGFVNSGYRLWHYEKSRSGIGISNFNARRVYTHMIADPSTVEALGTIRLIDEETDKITAGLSSPNNPLSFRYAGQGVDKNTIELAKDNRPILFQNIMDNPELSIKAQAALLKEVLDRNDRKTANALFAYHRGILLKESNFRVMVDLADRKYNPTYVVKGIDYVNKIFGVLGDKNNDKQPNVEYKKPKGKYFGFDIDFGGSTFESFLG